MSDRDLGHSLSCQERDRMRSICECDGIDLTEADGDLDTLIGAMVATGWEHRGSISNSKRRWVSFHRSFVDQIITIARVSDGWQFRWEMKPTLTIKESHKFGTLQICMNEMWKEIGNLVNHYFDVQRTLARELSKR